MVRQYQRLFELEHVRLEFDDEAIIEVARRSIANKSGARGLQAIMEKAMLDIMYEVPFLKGSSHVASPSMSFVARDHLS